MTKPYLLAIDNGTQSVRALLFDLQGNLVCKSQIHLSSYKHPTPGWMENDPQAFWDSVCKACQALWANTHIPKSAVAGVVITTQRGTTVNLDKDGQALRPSMIWLDQRRADVVPKISWLWQAALRSIGMLGTIDYFQREAEANWIAQHQPEIWAKTDKFLMLSGYLNFRMTGRYVDSVASQVGYIPFDYKHGRWANAMDWKWQAMPITASMLPDLVQAGTVIGQISATAAAETGIPIGTPLVAGAADKACEILGAGCLTPEVACLSYGTAATVNTTSPRYVEVTRFIPPYQAAVPGHYNTEVQITRGFWMVNWFKEQFGLLEQQIASEQGVSAESLFDELVNSVPPGAQGLMLQPFWNPGIKVPGPEARGAVIGFGDSHTRAHLYRAILEGLAYALREGMERTQKRSGQAIQRVRVSGGGSQSDAAMQITANVFNLPCERPHLYETSGLGAAMVAAVGLGLQPDFESTVRHMTRIGQVFMPEPVHAKTYEKLYKRVYCRMYRQLQPLYHELQHLTG
jgi:sugar (pentulose or hexulose) kinase